MDNSQNMPKDVYEIISKILQYIEKSEADYISDIKVSNTKGDKNENS